MRFAGTRMKTHLDFSVYLLTSSIRIVWTYGGCISQIKTINIAHALLCNIHVSELCRLK